MIFVDHILSYVPRQMAMPKPTLLAWASIRVMEDQAAMRRQSQCISAYPDSDDEPMNMCISDPASEAKQEYRMSLARTNTKRVVSTKLCDVTACTLGQTIHDYIEEEELVESVLHCVDLGQNKNMSCERLGRILELLVDFQIQGVDLSWNPHLSDSMIATIRPLLEAKKSHLADLKIAGCGLSVAGLKCLVEVASKSRLRSLNISYIRIGDESELIEQVLELPMIEDLALRYCDLSPSDARTIAEALPFTSVKSLDLAGNTFGSQGLVHLASKLPESMVERLDLSKVGIEKKCEGLIQLAKAWVKRPFPKLHILGNPMGFKEVMNFIAVLQTLMPTEDVDETFMGNISLRPCC
jgi:hypothetical protein